ncbi:hypothetical protein M409DRAFT_63934 [Zasmidium cellare ATCC 36951]|uniref:NAD(P)-binding protein n=1 Tax=Zasmidium cellare ATCC 36951 TaxID=1080233 RepID=A0A6A6CXD0_ZASCE|nr:uncharacterized protein M409DRAFT_63934 [Zasmidium cellare ATCC 36951]KAF2170908.1 hypothetical protein M409DRAFT_63934 [Zasmidium cellare ATCC 36951]
MSSFVITGTSRGIGLELVAQLLQYPQAEVSHIFAITRSNPSPQLQDLLQRHQGRLFNVIVQDLTDNARVASAVSEIEAALLTGQGIDYLIDNAGIMPWTSPVSAAKKEVLLDCFNVNVVAAHTITSALIPLLSKGDKKTVVNLSTAMGSIAYTPCYTFAQTPEYKISKAAMNMLTAQYALEFADQGFTFLAISPGGVKTDLGGPSGDLEVSIAVQAIREILVDEGRKERNGKFFNVRVEGWESAEGPNQYDGREIPW